MLVSPDVEAQMMCVVDNASGGADFRNLEITGAALSAFRALSGKYLRPAGTYGTLEHLQYNAGLFVSSRPLVNFRRPFSVLLNRFIILLMHDPTFYMHYLILLIPFSKLYMAIHLITKKFRMA